MSAFTSVPQRFSLNTECCVFSSERNGSQDTQRRGQRLSVVVSSLPWAILLTTSSWICVKPACLSWQWLLPSLGLGDGHWLVFLWVAFAGNELFAGLYSDYWGRDSAIFRSMGKLGHIRTEHDDERLLKGRSEETMENESTVHDWVCDFDNKKC